MVFRAARVGVSMLAGAGLGSSGVGSRTPARCDALEGRVRRKTRTRGTIVSRYVCFIGPSAVVLACCKVGCWKPALLSARGAERSQRDASQPAPEAVHKRTETDSDRDHPSLLLWLLPGYRRPKLSAFPEAFATVE